MINKLTTLKKKSDTEEYFSYGELLKLSCLLDEGKHIPLTEQRIRFKVADYLETVEVGAEFTFGKEWMPIIKKCVSAISFNVLSRELVEFLDEVEALV